MDDLVQRLRGGVFGDLRTLEACYEASDEIARLRAQLAEQQAAAAWCEKHQPKGGARGQCVICAGYALSAALSKISYLCGKPNEMGASIYDVDCDEDAVVERVKAMRAQLAERGRDVERYRWLRARKPGGKYRIAGLIYSDGDEHFDAAIDAAMGLPNKINPVV